jgi:bifunctional non-homologous end joining protein LigD
MGEEKNDGHAGRGKSSGVDIADVLSDKNGPVNATVVVDDCEVKLTNLNKVYWPVDGYTKRDLLNYYYQVAPVMLPHLADRPLILKRYPNGIHKEHFFQHDVPDAPEFVDIYERAERGRTVCYAVCNNTATLLYLANLGAISFDAWMSKVEEKTLRPPIVGEKANTSARPSSQEEKEGIPTESRPDYIVFDLDPDVVPMERVCEVALAVRDELGAVGLDCYPKTSGASGFHVYMPVERIYQFDEMLRFANVIAAQVSARMPKLVTTERRVSERGSHRVYLDCYQNSEGKSVAAVYSARARAGATVSAPLAWDEVEGGVRIEDYSIVNMPERIARRGDLFQGVLTNCQRLSGAITKLEERIRDK